MNKEVSTRWLWLLQFLFSAVLGAAGEICPDYPVQPVRFADVTVDDSFWSPRLATNRAATVPAVLRQCEKTGIIDNFAKAAGLMKGSFRGNPWDDSVVGTALSAVYNSLALQRDPQLELQADQIVRWIGAAQEADGYIYTARKLLPPEKLKPSWAYERWVNERSSHELFNAGHLYEAAVSCFEATGKREFLDIVLKNADLVCRDFGPGACGLPPGHQEIELALVKLYRVTGQRKYLDCAKHLLDLRGRSATHKLYGGSAQDHLPVTEQAEAVGHQVRAMYMYAAMADVAALTGDAAYIGAMEKIWNDFVSCKMYLTGGASGEGESFARPYHLPNRKAYCETCASIASALWNHRMFLLSGDSKYMDVFERVLYNGLISGVSMDGEGFYYKNPLEADSTNKFNHGYIRRSPWQGCPCCPPNIARFIPSVPGYIYGVARDNLYINLFAGSKTAVQIAGQKVKVSQETRYPWDGKVTIRIDDASAVEFGVKVRLPGWVLGRPVPSDLYRYEKQEVPEVKLAVNGTTVPLTVEKGYAVVRRVWKSGDRLDLDFPMPVRRVLANDKVEADRGRVALERGPIVYCAEGVDNSNSVESLVVEPGAILGAEHRPDLLGGVTVVRGRVARVVVEVGGQSRLEPVELIAVPYSTWANRGVGPMAVWFATGPGLVQFSDKAADAVRNAVLPKGQATMCKGAE